MRSNSINPELEHLRQAIVNHDLCDAIPDVVWDFKAYAETILEAALDVALEKTVIEKNTIRKNFMDQVIVHKSEALLNNFLAHTVNQGGDTISVTNLIEKQYSQTAFRENYIHLAESFRKAYLPTINKNIRDFLQQNVFKSSPEVVGEDQLEGHYPQDEGDNQSEGNEPLLAQTRTGSQSLKQLLMQNGVITKDFFGKPSWSKSKISPAEHRIRTIVTARTEHEIVPATHNSHAKKEEHYDASTLTSSTFYTKEGDEKKRYVLRLPSVVKGYKPGDAKKRLEDAFDKLESCKTKQLTQAQTLDQAQTLEQAQAQEKAAEKGIFCVRVTSLDDRAVRITEEIIDENKNKQTATARAELEAVEAINLARLASREGNSKPPHFFMQLNINQHGEPLDVASSDLAKKACVHNELALIATVFENRDGLIGEDQAPFLAQKYQEAIGIYKSYLKREDSLDTALKELRELRQQLTSKLLPLPGDRSTDDLLGKQTILYTLIKLMSLENNQCFAPKNTWLTAQFAQALQTYTAGGCKSAMDRYTELQVDVNAALDIMYPGKRMLDSRSQQVVTEETQGDGYVLNDAGVLFSTPTEIQSVLYDTQVSGNEGEISQLKSTRIDAMPRNELIQLGKYLISAGPDPQSRDQASDSLKSFIAADTKEDIDHERKALIKAWAPHAKNHQCSQEHVWQSDGYGPAKLSPRQSPSIGMYGVALLAAAVNPVISMVDCVTSILYGLYKPRGRGEQITCAVVGGTGVVAGLAEAGLSISQAAGVSGASTANAAAVSSLHLGAISTAGVSSMSTLKVGAVCLAAGALGAIPVVGWIALAAVAVASAAYLYNVKNTYDRFLTAENTNNAGFFDRDPKVDKRLKLKNTEAKELHEPSANVSSAIN